MKWEEFVDHLNERLKSGEAIASLSRELDGVRFCWTGTLRSTRLCTTEELLDPSVNIEMPTRWLTTPDGTRIRCRVITVWVQRESASKWELCAEGDEVQFCFTLRADGPFECIRLPKDAGGGRRLSLSAFDGECDKRTRGGTPLHSQTTPVTRPAAAFELRREHKSGPSKLPQQTLTWSSTPFRCDLPDGVDLTPAILREFWVKVLGDGLQQCDEDWPYLVVDIRVDVGQISAQLFRHDLTVLESTSVLISIPSLASHEPNVLFAEFGDSPRCEVGDNGTGDLLAQYYGILFSPLMEPWADEPLRNIAGMNTAKRLLGTLDGDFAHLAEFVWV